MGLASDVPDCKVCSRDAVMNSSRGGDDVAKVRDRLALLALPVCWMSNATRLWGKRALCSVGNSSARRAAVPWCDCALKLECWLEWISWGASG